VHAAPRPTAGTSCAKIRCLPGRSSSGTGFDHHGDDHLRPRSSPSCTRPKAPRSHRSSRARDPPNTVCVEKLQAGNMTRGARGTSSTASSSASHRQRRTALLLRARARQGTRVELVDPRGTSQTCNACGYRHYGAGPTGLARVEPGWARGCGASASARVEVARRTRRDARTTNRDQRPQPHVQRQARSPRS
jgi:hypothetical protein